MTETEKVLNYFYNVSWSIYDFLCKPYSSHTHLMLCSFKNYTEYEQYFIVVTNCWRHSWSNNCVVLTEHYNDYSVVIISSKYRHFQVHIWVWFPYRMHMRDITVVLKVVNTRKCEGVDVWEVYMQNDDELSQVSRMCLLRDSMHYSVHITRCNCKSADRFDHTCITIANSLMAVSAQSQSSCFMGAVSRFTA